MRYLKSAQRTQTIPSILWALRIVQPAAYSGSFPSLMEFRPIINMRWFKDLTVVFLSHCHHHYQGIIIKNIHFGRPHLQHLHSWKSACLFLFHLLWSEQSLFCASNVFFYMPVKALIACPEIMYLNSCFPYRI